jgi:FkbM family methyltransferase
MRIPSLGLFWLLHQAKQAAKLRFGKDEFGMRWWQLRQMEFAPRYLHTYSTMLGKRVELTDPLGFSICYREIFLTQLYKFTALGDSPLIIDCGANVGLSVIYFKTLYPHARVIAFEPDREVFQVLTRNVETFQFTDVVLFEKAIWVCETKAPFKRDGGVGGRLVPVANSANVQTVQTARLRDLLDQKIDFLKIDIEGAECEVLKDCEGALQNVDHLFVEYHSKRAERQSLQNLLNILVESGFRYHILEAATDPNPFITQGRKGYFDLQLNVFAFRN